MTTTLDEDFKFAVSKVRDYLARARKSSGSDFAKKLLEDEDLRKLALELRSELSLQESLTQDEEDDWDDSSCWGDDSWDGSYC